MLYVPLLRGSFSETWCVDCVACEPYGDLNLQRVEQQIDGLEWFIATSSVEADKTAAKDMQEKIRDLVKWAVESKFVYTDLREAQKEGLDTKNIHANLNDADQAKYEFYRQRNVSAHAFNIVAHGMRGPLAVAEAAMRHQELAGALTVTFVNWLNVNRNTTIQNAIVAPGLELAYWLLAKLYASTSGHPDA
jgi:hypothetical protein